MKKLLTIFSAFLLLSFTIIPVYALETISGEDFSVSVPVEDDLYLAGGEIKVSSNINGDAFIAGGKIQVLGDVSADLSVGGGEISIMGNIGDDVRIAGGRIIISSEVLDDLIVFGGEVTLTEDAHVMGDLIIAGGDVSVYGKIDGNVKLSGGRVFMNAEVQGDALLATGQLMLGDDAMFYGSVSYGTAEGEIDFTEKSQGEVAFNEKLKPFSLFGGDSNENNGMLISLLTAAFVLFILVSFAPKKYTKAASKKLHDAFATSFGVGVLYFLLTPILILLLLISVIGIPFGFLAMMIYGFSFYFAKPVTSIVVANLIDDQYKKKWTKTSIFFISLGIYIILTGIGFIPVIGWIAVLVAVVSGFGACTASKYELFKKAK